MSGKRAEETPFTAAAGRLHAERVGPIVSSAHLAEGQMPELSELEFGLILAGHAFSRWIVRAMAAVGYPDLSTLDVLVLHTVNHRGRTKTLADICLVLNVEDTHTVSYALKKLQRLGLVESGRKGKEKTAAITAEGEAACTAYREVRERLLIQSVQALGLEAGGVSTAADVLRALSGQYDQSARAAASL